jgi:hypothetical protein
MGVGRGLKISGLMHIAERILQEFVNWDYCTFE